jgi:hypothetical protein
LFFLQEDGAAMGTSCAVLYACMYYGFHEMKTLLAQFSQSLKLLKRFVDDMIGIWIGTDERFEEFKQALPFGKLKWDVSDLSHSVDFLDLTVTIENGRIVTRTYEKALNKYLYIPPRSAHAPGTLKSTIFGNIRRYWFQNSTSEVYRSQVRKFFTRLEARGHARADLIPIFKEAFKILANESTISNTSTNSAAPQATPLFQHGEYHPRGVSKREVRRIYRETLEEHCDFDRFIVAYSRPRNIRNALIKSKLSDTDGVRASEFITVCRSNMS